MGPPVEPLLHMYRQEVCGFKQGDGSEGQDVISYALCAQFKGQLSFVARVGLD